MGKQSSRIFFGGMDHKDIYFQGHYHKAMYLGSEKLWEKLADQSGDVRWTEIYIPDLFGDSYVINSGTKKTISLTVNEYINGLPTIVKGYGGSGEWFFWIVSLKSNGQFTGRYSHFTSYQLDWFGQTGSGESYGTPPKVYRYSEDSPNHPFDTYYIFDNAENGLNYWIGYHEYGMINSVANTELGWMVDFSISKNKIKYSKVSIGSTGKSEFGRFTESICYVDGIESDASYFGAAVRYYSDTNATLVSCMNGILITQDGLNYNKILQEKCDDCERLVTYFKDKYVIVTDESGVMDSSGNKYDIPYEKKIHCIFSKGSNLYLSFDDGMLLKTTDLKKYSSKNMGKVVSASENNIFLSHTSHYTISDGRIPVAFKAVVDF